jgi:ubiquinone/menaquinone biosynthesis C-methylase UbiE
MASPEMDRHHYIIRGGVEGRDRLKVLARVMRPATLSLLERAGLRPGMVCLDAGCGSGDVTFDLARLVGPAGRVVGMDIDSVKIELARSEAATEGIANVEFRLVNISESDPEPEFDFVHSRFLLTHLLDPAGTLKKIREAMRPGGILAVSDIDFRGYFSHPDFPAARRFAELYTETVNRRGGDPNIGPRLPGLLAENGFENVQMNIVQPAGFEGEVKLMSPLTMEAISDSVVAEGLASKAETDEIVAELAEFAARPDTVLSMPRVVEAWGHRKN